MKFSAFRMMRSACEQVYNHMIFNHFGVSLEKRVGHIEGMITIRAGEKNSIRIGSGVELRSGKSYNIIGGDTRLCLRTIGKGKIIIGKNVGISNSTIVSQNAVFIEDNVMIGGSCKIYDTDFHSLEYSNRIQFPDPDVKSKPITIKQGAFIGAYSIILKGVTIGRHSVIGAGSVVSKSVPDGEVWAGNPARFIKKIEN